MYKNKNKDLTSQVSKLDKEKYAVELKVQETQKSAQKGIKSARAVTTVVAGSNSAAESKLVAV